jgi:hypothetical protein
MMAGTDATHWQSKDPAMSPASAGILAKNLQQP